MARDPVIEKTDRENAIGLAKYYRKRAADLRGKSIVLASDYENHVAAIARYENLASKLEAAAK